MDRVQLYVLLDCLIAQYIQYNSIASSQNFSNRFVLVHVTIKKQMTLTQTHTHVLVCVYLINNPTYTISIKNHFITLQ